MNLLFSPFQLGGKELKNRMVFPPTTTSFATPKGEVTPKLVDYYRQRAAGGVGTVIMEPGVVNPRGKLTSQSMEIYTEESVTFLKEITGIFKTNGAAAFIQLAHSGPRGRASFLGERPVSPSGIPFFQDEPVEELTREGIDRVVKDFVAAALRAQQAGFDGIELHGAHGYLLSSFLSPIMNRRTDEYGGSNRNRAKIMVDIITGIREQVGNKILIGVRLNGKEYGEQGLADSDAIELARIFEAAGADLLHVSALEVEVPALVGVAAIPATSAPGRNDPHGPFLRYARQVKKAVHIPVIAVGKLDNPEVAEKALAEKDCDLVALGRSLIVDPNWPNKVKDGSTPDQCLYCNTCFKGIAQGGLICAVNPELKAKK
ncbi:NADH:flavin oxidoreductase [Desulforamulus ruminis]|uniref:NADH:flavin oxidoreductase n=1 Tax=Desulforamulus ruminis TaxID=1564 RepID=UPI002355F697|nr:NADH:flavin oxidoreductase [Desulforamulus ruminis]